MTIRGFAVQRLLNRVGQSPLQQSVALPTTPGDLVFLGDGLSLHGAWDEWFPESAVRMLGGEALRIDEASQLLASIPSPSALVIMLGNADLLGLAGSTSAGRAAARLDALVGRAAERVDTRKLFVVGVPRRTALGDRAAQFNAQAAALINARGATFVPAPDTVITNDDGFVLSLLRWDATVYSQLAHDLAVAMKIPIAAGNAVSPIAEFGNGFLLKSQRKRAQLFEALPTPRGRVVLYGDSITEGGSWDGWLPGLAIANRGIGGDTVAQLAARIDTAIDSPRAVSLLAGTNDLQRGEPRDPDSIARRFRELVAQIRERDADVPIVINSVMPRAAKFADAIGTINTRYREVASEFGATYLDLWPVLATANRSLRSELTPDGLHLNADGYREWVALLGPVLQGMVDRRG